MGNTVHPDGGKIRALRIQRGWTQEQLAEIAGVNPRTVQRAESADRASFDTLRGIAGAFGTDFEELLKATALPDARRSNHSPVPPAAVAPVKVERTTAAASGGWRPLWLAVPGLILGAVVGGFLMRLPGPDPTRATGTAPAGPRDRSPASAAGERSMLRGDKAGIQPAPNAGAEGNAPHDITAEAGSGSAARRSTSIRNPLAVPRPSPPVLAEDRANTLLQASTGRTGNIIALESRAESPLQMALPPSSPAVPVEFSPLTPDGSSEGPGAVRQAMGQAGRKTGVFFARFGASMRKAF